MSASMLRESNDEHERLTLEQSLELMMYFVGLYTPRGVSRAIGPVSRFVH